MTGDPATPPARGADPAGADPAAAYAEIAQLLGQVTLAYTASGLRYWQRMLEIWGTVLPTVARTVAEASASRDGGGAGSTAALSDLATLLRELAEAPYQESRHVVADLERIFGASTWRARPEAAPGAGEEDYWRRWEVKP